MLNALLMNDIKVVKAWRLCFLVDKFKKFAAVRIFLQHLENMVRKEKENDTS